MANADENPPAVNEADKAATATVAAPELKAEARPEGSGFRAVITRDGRVIWACSHVHFTDHSAKADAQARLLAMQSLAPA